MVEEQDRKIYIVDPVSRSGPILPDDVLDKITAKIVGNSKRLAKVAHK